MQARETPVAINSTLFSKNTPMFIFDMLSLYFPPFDQTHETSFYKMFRDYVALNDDLISLIFENSYFDIKCHCLKIMHQRATTDENFKIKKGEFDCLSRTIAMDLDLPFAHETFIHELSHSAIFFLFKPHSKIFGKVTPYTEQLSSRAKSFFNPSELKFKQCIREDMAKHQEIGDYLFSPVIDMQFFYDGQFSLRSFMIKAHISSFFSDIQSNYTQDIYSEDSSKEIFSFYMQLRGSLLLLAHDYNISKSDAIAILEKHFPRLHAYFETDIKRLLKNRLRDLINDQGRDLKSSILKPSLIKNNFVKNADLNYVIRGFWYERLARGTGYLFFLKNHPENNIDTDKPKEKFNCR